MNFTKAEAELLVEALHWNGQSYKEKFSSIPEIRAIQQETWDQMNELRQRIKAFAKTL